MRPHYATDLCLAESLVSDLGPIQYQEEKIDTPAMQVASQGGAAPKDGQLVGSGYLEVSFGTACKGNLVLPGLTWSVTWFDLECYLVLSGVLPGFIWSVTWFYLECTCYLGVTVYLGLYFGVVFFFCDPKISAFLKLLGKRSIFTWRCYLLPK